MGLFFSLRGPLCAGEAFIPSRPGGPSAAQCYMARRDVGPRFVPRCRSLLHPTYLRWLLKQKADPGSPPSNANASAEQTQWRRRVCVSRAWQRPRRRPCADFWCAAWLDGQEMTWLRSLNKLNMGALRRCATRDVKRARSNPGDQSGHVAGVGCWGVGLGY